MSEKAKGYPHKQGFCVNPKPCKSKKNAWFQHAPFHNNSSRSNRKQSESNQ